MINETGMTTGSRDRRASMASAAFALLRIILATALLSVLVLRATTGSPTTNHFAFLAQAFDRGTFSVGTLPENYADTITQGDQVFLPMGPAPAMLMMPFVSVAGITFDEFWLSLILTLLNMWVVRLILREIGVRDPVRIQWFLALFFAGTIYFATLILGRSWFLAHIVATSFLLLAIYLALRRASVFGVGLLLGMAFLTRSTTVLAFPFFLLVFADQAKSTPRPLIPGLKRGLGMLSGLVIPFLFFFVYNYVRFGNPLDTGYARALPGATPLQEALRYGLFSLAHVPKNLYMLLLSVPQPLPSIDSPVLTFPWIAPSRWGMGIFFTTPAFVYAFLANRHLRLVQGAWVAVLAILPFLLLYYGVGYNQFGYRYALDFYPFLFILTALGLDTRFNRPAKALIVICIVVNVWGAWHAALGSYAEPLFHG